MTPTPITTEELARLRGLAERATTGPWFHRQADTANPKDKNDCWDWIGDAPKGEQHSKIIVQRNCLYGGAPDYAYIAALSPSTILALLDALSAQQGKLDDLFAVADVAEDTLDKECLGQVEKHDYDAPDDADCNVTFGTVRKINAVFNAIYKLKKFPLPTPDAPPTQGETAGITEAAWKCACGWKGVPSQMVPNPSGCNCCPDCGASGGLVLNDKAPSLTAREKALEDRLYSLSCAVQSFLTCNGMKVPNQSREETERRNWQNLQEALIKFGIEVRASQALSAYDGEAG